MAVQNYVVGRGKLYLDRFAEGVLVGTGERYLGNTPSLSLSQNITTLEHYSSDEGLKIKDAAVNLQSDITATFSTDNIDPDNLAMWFSGDSTAVTQVGGCSTITETRTVSGDRYYQLGATPANPLGNRNVTALVVKIGAVTVPDDGVNYTADPLTGRVYIVPGGTLSDDAEGIFSYTLAATTFSTTIERGSQVFGALRFISANPVGDQRDYFFPYVKIASDGDYSLKGDEWQVMSFTVDLLQLSPDIRRIYMQTR